MIRLLIVLSCGTLVACDRHELTAGPTDKTAPQRPAASKPANLPPANPSIETAAVSEIARDTVYVVRFSDPDGLRDLQWGQILFNKSLAGVNGCYLHWENSGASLYLFDDAGKKLLGPAKPGRKMSLENSQCMIDVARVESSQTRDTLTLSIPVRHRVTGLTTTFVRAADVSGHTLEWRPIGRWNIR